MSNFCYVNENFLNCTSGLVLLCAFFVLHKSKETGYNDKDQTLSHSAIGFQSLLEYTLAELVLSLLVFSLEAELSMVLESNQI